MAQVHPHPHGRALPQKLPSLLENKGWDQDDDLQAKVKQHAAEVGANLHAQGSRRLQPRIAACLQ